MSRHIIRRVTGLSTFTPRQDLLPLGPVVLPAANAFQSFGPIVFGVQGLNEVAIWISYLSANATGQLAIRPLFDYQNASPARFNSTINDPAVTAAQPFGTQNFYKQTMKGPIPGAGFSVQFVKRIPIPQGAVTVGFDIADLGGAPGSLQELNITLGSNAGNLLSS